MELNKLFSIYILGIKEPFLSEVEIIELEGFSRVQKQSGAQVLWMLSVFMLIVLQSYWHGTNT